MGRLRQSMVSAKKIRDRKEYWRKIAANRFCEKHPSFVFPETSKEDWDKKWPAVKLSTMELCDEVAELAVRAGEDAGRYRGMKSQIKNGPHFADQLQYLLAEQDRLDLKIRLQSAA